MDSCSRKFSLAVLTNGLINSAPFLLQRRPDSTKATGNVYIITGLSPSKATFSKVFIIKLVYNYLGCKQFARRDYAYSVDFCFSCY